MNVVFFDILATGHHSEYIDHLCEFIIKNKKNNNYFFLVNPSFKSLFPKIVEKTKTSNYINWIEISNKDFNKTQKGNIISKSFNYFMLLKKYSNEIIPSNVILLDFNLFVLPLIFFRPKYNIQGILFHQFTRYRKDKFKYKIKSFCKLILFKMCLINDRLSALYILNDLYSVKKLNKKCKTNKFQFLPDPIPILNPIKGFNIYNYYNLDKKRKILLHFGALGDRKGTFEILESIYYMPKKNQKEIILLFVGKFGITKEKEKFLYEMEKVKHNSVVDIFYDDRFVSNELMKSLFNECHGVLMPYKNPEGSSGVLGHAVASNKKIITTGKGLLGDIVASNNFGYLVDEVCPKLISSSIVLLIKNCDNQNINPKINEFLDNHSSKSFSKKIIDNILIL